MRRRTRCYERVCGDTHKVRVTVHTRLRDALPPTPPRSGRVMQVGSTAPAAAPKPRFAPRRPRSACVPHAPHGTKEQFQPNASHCVLVTWVSETRKPTAYPDLHTYQERPRQREHNAAQTRQRPHNIPSTNSVTHGPPTRYKTIALAFIVAFQQVRVDHEIPFQFLQVHVLEKSRR